MTSTSSARTRAGRRTRATLAGLLALTTAAAGIGATSAPAGAATKTVCAAGCDHTSIAAATAAAVNGDVITVAAGTYNEPRIVISQKGITLQGAGSGQTIIDGQLRNDLVGGEGQIRVESAALASGPITVRGLTLRNAPKSATGPYRYAVQVKASRPDPAPITFTDVDIEGADTGDYGMYVNGATGVAEPPFTFEDGSITGTRHHAILFENWRGPVTVEDSTISESTGNSHAIVGMSSDAIAERATGTYAFRRNTFTGNSLAVFRQASGAQGFDSVVVEDNTFGGLAGTDAAVTVTSSGTAGFPTDLDVAGNTVTGTGAATRGLALTSSSGNPVGPVTATGNSFGGVGTGVAVSGTGYAGAVDLSQSRFRTPVGVAGTSGTAVDAEEGWWGCNGGPGASGCATATGTTDADPWLVATAAAPSNVASKGTGAVTADLTHLSDGTTLADLPAVFDAVPTGYSAARGSVTPATGTLADGVAPTATYTAPVGPWLDTVTATVDGVATALPVEVGGSGIRGTVTSADTGAPVAGLQVRLFKDGAASSSSRTTDGDGRYSFGALGTGSYEVWYRDVSGHDWISEYHGGATTRAAGTPIALTAGEVVVADGSLTPLPPVIPVTLNSISGRVTDPEGDPIPGIQVRLYSEPYTTSAATTTDADGEYSFDRRTPGAYKLWFRDLTGKTWVNEYDGEASTLDDAEGVTLTEAGGVTADATLARKPGAPSGTPTGGVAGVVMSEQGQPIAGIQVRLYKVGATGSSATTTAADGSFSFTRRAVGNYQLWFRDMSGHWVSEYYEDASSLATAGWINVAPGGTNTVWAALAAR